MGRSLLMCGAPAFAGDLALFFGRHRRKAATFLAFSWELGSFIHNWTLTELAVRTSAYHIRSLVRLRRRILDGRWFWLVRRGLGRLVRRAVILGSPFVFVVHVHVLFGASPDDSYRWAVVSNAVPRTTGRMTAESARKSLIFAGMCEKASEEACRMEGITTPEMHAGWELREDIWVW